MEIGTETMQILFWEYLFPIFGIVSLQCDIKKSEVVEQLILGEEVMLWLNWEKLCTV